MTQYINLYQSQFHKKRDWNKLLKLTAFYAFFILLFLINMYQLKSIDNTKKNIIAAKNEYQKKEVIYKNLSLSVKQRAKNMSLESEVMRIRELNREKQNVLNILDGDDIGNMSGFSLLLEGLGRQRDKINDIWITKLSIKSGGFDMQLKGNNTHPGDLLSFIEELYNEELFKNKNFKQVKINSRNKQAEFFLDTENITNINDKEEYLLLQQEFFSTLNNLYDMNSVLK